MGKAPYIYTDSDASSTSSVEYLKKKKRLSILKHSQHSSNNVKKKSKHSKSDPDYSGIRSISSHRVRYKLPGILKNSNVEKERESSDDDEETDYSRYLSRDRCLVGRVPFGPGCKPGRGGGLAILVKKNVSSMQPQQSTSSTKRKRKNKLNRKKSY